MNGRGRVLRGGEEWNEDYGFKIVEMGERMLN